MGGELAEEYSEVLAEVLKGHFNGTLDETKYFIIPLMRCIKRWRNNKCHSQQ